MGLVPNKNEVGTCYDRTVFKDNRDKTVELGIEGKSVLITGGSKGIGLACAIAFAREGCNIELVARTGAALNIASDAIRAQYQVNVTTHALDLSDSKNIDSLLKVAGTADILVNNAGAIPGGSIETVDKSTWRTGWDLKVYGYINMTRAFLARMTERGHGVIINIIGTGGEKLDYNFIAGATGNASLMAFTRGIGARSIHQGVRVLGVNPGPVETDRIKGIMQQKAKAEFGDENRAAAP